MEKYLIKTHYENAKEHLGMIIPGIFTQEMSGTGTDPTYQEFCEASLETISKLDFKGNLSNYFNTYFHMYQMMNHGEQIYYITPTLSARLAQTNCNSDVYFLRSPFREIFIQIDPGLFYINDLNGEKNPVHGFYVYLRDFETSKHIRVMACSLLKSTPEIQFNDANFYFHMEFDSGKIKDQLSIYFENEVRRKKEELDKYDLFKNVDHLQEFAMFVFNTLLYITSKNPDIQDREPIDFTKKLEALKSKNKKKKLEQRREKATAHKIIIVGSNIKDENNDMDRIKRAGGIAQWKLEHKILVPSHWRTQWYGSKKDNSQYRDIIWIDSYEKGPEYSELLISKHIVR